MQQTPMTTEEMKVLELNSEYLGVSLGTLMEGAGREVARVITEHEEIQESKILILCGTGGNGGDGLVAARHLHESGAFAKVVLIGDPKRISSPDTKKNWDILQELHAIPKEVLKTDTQVRHCSSLKEADIVVDALLGFGLTTKVREPIKTAIRLINKTSAVRYSIDVPSGMNSDSGKEMGTAVNATHTITMHAPKPGLLLNRELTGILHVVAIGIPAEAYHVCGRGDLWLFNMPRKPDTHKGDHGRILVVGGSDVFSGAPALAGLAALRTGADLASILAPSSVAPAIRAYSPNLMVQSLESPILDINSVDTVLDVALKNDVVALGPGLGMADETKSAFKEIAEALASLSKPLVIDADGLKALSKTGQVFEAENTILTPHWGELQILLNRKSKGSPDDDARLELAQEAANRYGAVVLLKGAIDIVADPEGNFKFNKTGTPAMTVGGTGDVLTGIAATMLSRRKGAYHAASAAAFVSGIAGELAVQKLGERILATDCIEQIPYAMK